jgi:hypothetical protein
MTCGKYDSVNCVFCKVSGWNDEMIDQLLNKTACLHRSWGSHRNEHFNEIDLAPLRTEMVSCSSLFSIS